MTKGEESILIDTDVLIHFNKAEKMSLLKELFPGRVYMLDFIIEELRSISGTQIDMMLKFGIVKEMAFPTRDMQILKEYTDLKKTKGKGESACMAICRYQKNILASSNLKDIKTYCAQYSIKYLTTMDILAIGFKKGVLSIDECDECIHKIISKGSKLPYATLQEYFDKDFDSNKLNY